VDTWDLHERGGGGEGHIHTLLGCACPPGVRFTGMRKGKAVGEAGKNALLGRVPSQAVDHVVWINCMPGLYEVYMPVMRVKVIMPLPLACLPAMC
jgi:hypothetical protein